MKTAACLAAGVAWSCKAAEDESAAADGWRVAAAGVATNCRIGLSPAPRQYSVPKLNERALKKTISRKHNYTPIFGQVQPISRPTTKPHPPEKKVFPLCGYLI